MSQHTGPSIFVPQLTMQVFLISFFFPQCFYSQQRKWSRFSDSLLCGCVQNLLFEKMHKAVFAVVTCSSAVILCDQCGLKYTLSKEHICIIFLVIMDHTETADNHQQADRAETCTQVKWSRQDVPDGLIQDCQLPFGHMFTRILTQMHLYAETKPRLNNFSF